MSGSLLERRYRLLLRVYPAGHRAAYEEEMVGVLMAGATPGRRRPGLGDAVDLVRAGLAARLGQAASRQRGSGWRDAAAVTGLVIAAMLAAVAGRRLLPGVRVLWFEHPAEPMEMFGVRGLLLLDVSLRFLFWAAVCATALLGLRRVAAGLAGVAAVVELGAVLWWLPHTPVQSSVRLSWSVVTVGIVVAALAVARRGRPLPALLGRRGLLLFTGTAAGVLLSEVLSEAAFAAGHPLPVRFLDLTVLGLVAIAVLSVAPGVRSRAAVLLVPAFIGPLTWELALGSDLLLLTGPGADVAWWTFLVLASPLISFGAALVVLWAWRVSASGGEAKKQGYE
ncbi:hypothetical protein AB0C07_00885 [Actinoplanes missouriensis]|uniref:hypothetical protein n=1 Tax=Actinoplanes missouriensis TaxID=1866 RepID=UPI0033EBECC1